ncbi:MAG: PIN domain-containing protein [Anaerolineae bacterium]|nr:PIN domain-containing protein [Anaerolineae bacterium]
MAQPTRILIDLNIILEVLQRREPFYAASAQLLAAAETGRLHASIAAHSVTTLFYLIAKDQSAQRARVILSDLLQFLQVASVTPATIEQALALPMTDFEDAVQLAAALEARADYLITRNIKDYPEYRIPVLQPAEFLTLLA